MLNVKELFVKPVGRLLPLQQFSCVANKLYSRTVCDFLARLFHAMLDRPSIFTCFYPLPVILTLVERDMVSGKETSFVNFSAHF